MTRPCKPCPCFHASAQANFASLDAFTSLVTLHRRRSTSHALARTSTRYRGSPPPALFKSPACVAFGKTPTRNPCQVWQSVRYSVRQSGRLRQSGLHAVWSCVFVFCSRCAMVAVRFIQVCWQRQWQPALQALGRAKCLRACEPCSAHILRVNKTGLSA